MFAHLSEVGLAGRSLRRGEDDLASSKKCSLPKADVQAIRGEVRTRTQSRQLDWQQASIREIRQMLAKKLGID